MNALYRWGPRMAWVLPVLGGFLAMPVRTQVSAQERVVLWIEGGPVLQCAAVKGTYLGFLVPGSGTLYVSARAFPGARRVGRLEKDRLILEHPAVGTVELKSKLFFPEARPVWGMLDRTLKIGTRRGCIAFAARRFTGVNDFLNYTHWILRNLFFPLEPEGAAQGLTLQVGSRRIGLEIEIHGYQPIAAEVREGSPYRIRVPKPPAVLVLIPVVLDSQGRRVAVICHRVRSGKDGGEVMEFLGVVKADPDHPGTLTGDLEVTVRVRRVR